MSQQSNPATLRELVRRWNEVASKIANRPTSTPETRAQATGWAQCADELEAALAASGTEAAPDEIAKRFHEAYERLAPSFGYHTRKESAVPWEQVPENNRKLMTAVVAEVLGQPAQAAASPEGEGPECEEFYNLMQLYRHAPITNPAQVKANYEEVKSWLRLRQSAAPSGGAIWCDSCGQDVTGESYRPHRYVICHKPGCADRYVKHSRNLDRRIDSPTRAQESKTGAVTETK